LDAEDAERAARETALNGLEAYIYKCKELSHDDDFEELATEAEREEMKSAIAEIGEWYDDNSNTALKADFNQQKNKLFKFAGPIFARRRELSMRPNAIESMEEALKSANLLYGLIQEKINLTDITETEVTALATKIKDEQNWLDDHVSKQGSVKNNVDPILKVKDLEDHIAALFGMIAKLDPSKRTKKSEPKKTKSSSASTSDSTVTEGSPPPTDVPLDDILEGLKDQNISKEDLKAIFDEYLKPNEKADEPQANEGEL
jgi:hypoxia up-regulated 1